MIILPVPPPPDSILYSGFSCRQSRRLHPHPALRATRSPFCRFATFSPDRGKSVPTGGRLMLRQVFRKAGNAPAAKKDCYTRCRAAVLCIVIKRI